MCNADKLVEDRVDVLPKHSKRYLSRLISLTCSLNLSSQILIQLLSHRNILAS